MSKQSEIRAERARVNWSQDKLAKEAGVSRQTIANMENDDFDFSSFIGKTVKKVHDALNIE